MVSAGPVTTCRVGVRHAPISRPGRGQSCVLRGGGDSRGLRSPPARRHGPRSQPAPFDLDSPKLKAYRDLYLWPIEIKDENMRAYCQLNLIGMRRAWLG